MLDEGGCVMTDGFSSLTKTAVAVVGTAEKVNPPVLAPARCWLPSSMQPSADRVSPP